MECERRARGRPRGFDRDEALRKAMETFWALGYEGASMAELTRAMGLASPSVYAAFGSKDALFQEALTFYEREMGKELAATITDAPTARAACEDFLVLSAQSLASPGHPPGCMIVRTAMGTQSGCGETRDALKGRRGGSAAMIEARLARAVADGELRQGLDLAAIAAFYVTVQQGMSIQAIDGASPERLMGVARGAMAAWDGLTSGA